MDILNIFLVTFIKLCTILRTTSGTYRYLGSYIIYGTGDTMIYTLHNHGGPRFPHRQWNVECLDGEAVVGIADLQDDFERIQELWCKFMFPYKPPSNGLYPYYPNCFYRNYTFAFHCYDPRNSSMSLNSFITAVWDDEQQFFTWRPVADDNCAVKCCTTPKGYYIDYGSCYYSPTHDQFGEYYDWNFMFLVYCSHGYVATGMAKKMNANSGAYNIDWLQCCRLGYGAPSVVSPPVIQGYSGHPSYVAREPHIPSQIPSGYHAQYRSLSRMVGSDANRTSTSPKRMWYRRQQDLEDDVSYKESANLLGMKSAM